MFGDTVPIRDGARNRLITMRRTLSRTLCVLLKWMIAGSGSVITDVILL